MFNIDLFDVALLNFKVYCLPCEVSPLISCMHSGCLKHELVFLYTCGILPPGNEQFVVDFTTYQHCRCLQCTH